jgi:hypothetical protein
MSQNASEVLIFLTSNMAKIVIFYPFTGYFVISENTKCRFFYLNPLIESQTQEKAKNALIWQITTL